jgi:hypothetical protein
MQISSMNTGLPDTSDILKAGYEDQQPFDGSRAALATIAVGVEMSSELKRFIDAVIVPALLERFLREHESAQKPTIRPAA